MVRAVVFVEVIQTPQRDWWVVADGRVVGLYLKSPDCPAPMEPAMAHGAELSKPYGMSILRVGTTWRSRAFDHLEDLSCRRGTCCRSRWADAEEGSWADAEEGSWADAEPDSWADAEPDSWVDAEEESRTGAEEDGRKDAM